MTALDTALDTAAEIVDLVNAALEDAGHKARATDDPARAESLALHGGVVLVGPPRLRWDTLNGATTRTWRLVVAVRHGSGGRAAWAALDSIVTAAADVLPVLTADPGQWRPTATADPLPSYTLTLADETETIP